MGASKVGVTADDLASGTGAVSFPTTAGGSVTFTTDMDANAKLINPMVDAAASASDAFDCEFSTTAENNCSGRLLN